MTRSSKPTETHNTIAGSNTAEPGVRFAVRSLVPELMWYGVLFKDVWNDWFVSARPDDPPPQSDLAAMAAYELFTNIEVELLASNLARPRQWPTEVREVTLPLPAGAGPLSAFGVLSHAEGIVDLQTDLPFTVQGRFALKDDNLVEGERWAEHPLTVSRCPFPFEDSDAAPGYRTLIQARDLWCVLICEQTTLYQRTTEGFRRIRSPRDLVQEPEEVIWEGRSLAQWRISKTQSVLSRN